MNRLKLLLILALMPDEAFGWFVVWTQNGFPDGLGGFQAASKDSIKALKAEGAKYMEGMG